MVDAVLPASFSLLAGIGGGAIALSATLPANQSIDVVTTGEGSPPAPSAAAFREAGVAYAGLGATTVDVPWCGLTGDLVLLAVTVRGAGTTATPAGWSVVSSFTTSFYRTDIFSRIKQAGDTGNIVVTVSASSAQTTIGQTFAFNGGATVTVGTPYLSTTSNLEIGPISGITVGVGEVVVVVGGRSNDWTAIDSLSGDGLTWQQIGNASTASGGDAGQVADCAANGTASAVVVSSKTWTTNEVGTAKGGVMLRVVP